MSFEKAHASFQSWAAKQLQAPEKSVQVVPGDEGAGDMWEGHGSLSSFKIKVGHAWGFEASTGGKSVRGWVAPDGTVISKDANLGLLFAEAHAWAAKPALNAEELAEHVIWAVSRDSRLLWDWKNDEKPPKLELKPDGSGTLKFLMGYRQPGPGGAGGGPEYVFECTVTLTKDHKAQFARGKNLNGGQEPPAGLL